MAVSDRIARDAAPASSSRSARRPTSTAHPASRFVAEFMGTTNLLEAHGARAGGTALVSLPARGAAPAPARARPAGGWPSLLAGTPVRLDRDAGPDSTPLSDVRLLGDGTLVRVAPARRPPDRCPRAAPVTLAYDPARADGRVAVRLAIPHQQRLPLAIAALGFALPRPVPALSAVQRLRRQRARRRGRDASRFANYVKVLGRPLLSRGRHQHADASAWSATHHHDAHRRAARLRAGPPADPRQGAILALAALPLVLPSFVSAYAHRAAARPRRHRHAVAAVLGHRLRLDLRRAAASCWSTR